MIITQLLNYLNHEDRNDINHIICAYLKDHMEEVPFMNIEEVSKNCHVSIGKMSGFIRKLGYENWIAFKDDCRFELSQRKTITASLQPFDTSRFDNEIQNDLSSIKQDLLNQDREKLKKLCADIQNAGNVFYFGTGYCRLVGEYLQMELALINKPVILMDEKKIGSYEIHTDDLLMVCEEPHDFTSTHPRIEKSLAGYACRKWIITAGSEESRILKERAEILPIRSRTDNLYDLRLEMQILLQIIIRILVNSSTK